MERKKKINCVCVMILLWGACLLLKCIAYLNKVSQASPCNIPVPVKLVASLDPTLLALPQDKLNLL